MQYLQQTDRYPLRRGFKLNQYHIDKPLGGGAFSVVYRGIDLTDKTPVIIKEYYPKDIAARNESGRIEPKEEKNTNAFNFGVKQYFGEASTLAKLKHPSIVNVLTIFRANNSVYIVMEYEKGRDLRWFIKKNSGVLDHTFITGIFPRIIDGLNEMHKHDFLHLDIKPANILLRSNGSPMLLDFGAVQGKGVDERFGSYQTLTHGFAPPEQYLEGNLGPWTDVYALAGTMYACMMRKSPPPALSRRAKDPLLGFLTQQRGEYPKELLCAVAQGLSLDSKDRPQSVAEFAKLAFGNVHSIAAATPTLQLESKTSTHHP